MIEQHGMTEHHRRLLVEAWNDDPDGQDHPIWAELGIPPQPPVSDEELWLIYRAVHTNQPEHWDSISTKVWDQTPDGRWTKLWQLTDSERDQLKSWRGHQARIG